MHITLRAGEKLYLNGAVLRADRKVSLELMNDAVFLLESHVMSVERATTPLRQLYFIVQTLLMNPLDKTAAQTLFDETMPRMAVSYADPLVLACLADTVRLVNTGRHFDALKILRGAFSRDDLLMEASKETLAIAS